MIIKRWVFQIFKWSCDMCLAYFQNNKKEYISDLIKDPYFYNILINLRLTFVLSLLTFDEKIIYKELIGAKYDKFNFEILTQEKRFICNFDEDEVVHVAQNLYKLMKINKNLVEDVLDSSFIDILKSDLELN